MTTNHTALLPTGSTTLEKRAAEVLAIALDNPILIADLINPDRCPENFLPYLAWTLSVDKWDEHWTEETKRLAIKNSYLIHKQKGTLAAVKRVIAPVGYLLELKEWFAMQPQGEAGTFSVTIEVDETGLTNQTYHELVRLIDDARPVSRHLVNLAIAITPVGSLKHFFGQYHGEITTIYP